MKLGLYFRIVVLIVAFAGVLWTMRALRSPDLQKGIADTFSAATGVGAGPENSVGSGAETTLDWCDTRIHALERPEHETLHQEKLKWMLGSNELDFISVEKWFGRNCRVKIERRAPSEMQDARPVMVVKFIKGPDETLFQTSTGLFRWRQEVFQSTELTEALKVLDALPRR